MSERSAPGSAGKSTNDRLNRLEIDMYGDSMDDKGSVSARLNKLEGTRAIQIWLVAILTGVGVPVVAGIILSVIK